MCTHANAHSHSVNHLGEMEREWLHLVRLNCMSYEHNRAEGCDRAISHAEMRYGADNGPLIASRITGIIRAMRAERNRRLRIFVSAMPVLPSQGDRR